MGMKRRKIKMLQKYLVRHGNLVDLLTIPKFIKFMGVTPKMVERERIKTWNKLMAAPPGLLKIAAEELNAREQASFR
jgi:hypothetical protein